VDRNPWIPEQAKPRENPKQRQFLLLTDKPEVFYGGAAGGGKTYASLIAAAQFVEIPGYSALLLRENFADLSQPDAWISLSKSWWLNKGPKWNSSDHRWTFPSGATITFGYLERDDSVYQYDSAAYQFIGIDELTQHTEWRYRFMFGRIRRPLHGPVSQIPVRMRSTSNPGNKGHDWVKKRFIDPKTRDPNTVFVPARLEDNAGNLDTESYRRDSLSKLDPLTRAQREKGDWDAIMGGRFLAEWFRYYGRAGEYISLAGKIFDPRNLPKFVTVDPAASEKTTADYTVISVWVISPWGDFVWLDCIRVQKEIPDIVPLIQKVCLRWHPKYVGIESVMANTAVYQLANRAVNPIIPARPLSPRGKDKLVNATPAIHVAAAGRLWLPDDRARGAFPVEDVVSEMTRFKGDDDDDHDDIVDTFSYAVQCEGTEPQGGPSKSRPSVYQG
jgi:phage terminase large subunit-like protein